MERRTSRATANRRNRQQLGVEELPLRDTRSLTEVKADVIEDRDDVTSLQQLAKKTAEDSSARTQRMLKMTEETRQVAVATAEQLEKQTGQLEKMDKDMDDIQGLVERSEKTVDKMIRPWYARVPGRGKLSKKDKEDKTKKNRKQKGSIQEIVDEEPEEQPTTSEFTEPVENNEDMRDDLLGDKPSDGGAAAQKPPRSRAKPRRTGQNAELLDELDKAEEEQENQLSEMGSMLRDLKGIASGMNQELDKQEVLIDGLDQSADMTTERIELFFDGCARFLPSIPLSPRKNLLYDKVGSRSECSFLVPLELKTIRIENGGNHCNQAFISVLHQDHTPPCAILVSQHFVEHPMSGNPNIALMSFFLKSQVQARDLKKNFSTSHLEFVAESYQSWLHLQVTFWAIHSILKTKMLPVDLLDCPEATILSLSPRLSVSGMAVILFTISRTSKGFVLVEVDWSPGACSPN
ncbi:hypothetical protein NDN08_001803 [Rhodosorus marinus]|uniref:t-SNARE coiled-coil homology domain-containing protein n=1 Tax=Rhodosorus marinus TaxID=101924 RepID=A0AAV8UUW1_9RHOD|nr:hypothetical protein NDN08_001803 [Rhodosorus marinus]